MSAGPRYIGFPQRRVEKTFPSSASAIPTDRPPILSNRVHSLVPSVLFGVPSPALPVRPCPARHSRAVLRQATAPARISSLIATSPAASTILLRGTRGFQPPLRSVHRFSQPLDGLLRHRFRRLVSSCGHVQGSIRPGVSPDSQRATARRRCLPPCRSDALAHRQAGCHEHARRLRGVAPRIDAFREKRRLDLLRDRAPLRVSSSLRDQLDHHEPRITRTGAIRS